MFHDSILALGALVALTVLTLACLSQRYWFARAWRFAGRIQEGPARKAMRVALLSLLLAVLLAAIAGVTRNVRGTVSRGSWWTAFL